VSTELIKNAELLTEAIAALAECDQDYRADYLLGARPEIVSTLRALLAALAGDGWQPIETAPKDGAAILIYHQRADAQGVAVPVIGGWFIPRGGPVKSPTHWMPLPEPPQ
jgi:hypothetical protein